MKRGQFEIIACILTEAMKPQKKTYLMYGCNLAWSTLTAYLPVLLDMGLLALTSERYKRTEKGEAWLTAYANLKEVMDMSCWERRGR